MAEVSIAVRNYTLYIILSCFVLLHLNNFSLVGRLRTSEIGQIGSFIEAESVSKVKKAGKLGGMENWYRIIYPHEFVNLLSQSSCLFFSHFYAMWNNTYVHGSHLLLAE